MLRIRRRETVQNGFGRSFSQHTINGILSKKSVYFRAKMQYNKIRFRAYHPSVFSPKPGVKSRFLTKKIEVAALYEIDELLKQVKRIHMIGIGGAGMCPLAEILLKEGYTLTGSDNNESDNLTKLRSLGVPVSMGHRAENIGNAEMVVYTAALLDDNPELCAAKTLGVPTLSVPNCSAQSRACIPTALAFAVRTAKPPLPRCSRKFSSWRSSTPPP